MKLGFLIYGLIFVSVGLGISMEQLVKLSFNGLWILGFGFILLIISCFIKEGSTEQ